MTVLLSGGTGSLGQGVLARIGQPVAVLVRGNDHEDRIAALRRRTGAELVGVPGDVRSPHWGIDRAALPSGISMVVHLAAETAWGASWERLEETNVVGTRHAVEVAGSLGVPLIHASSSFAAYDAAAVVPERLVEEQAGLTKYERSKCRAEWVVEAGRRDGLQAEIVRIGALVDDLNAPGGQRRRTRTPFLRLLRERQWPVVPFASGARIDMVPRDLTAGVICDHIARGVVDGLVAHIGLSDDAPTVSAILAEVDADLRADGRPGVRSARAPKSWLQEVSLVADRFAVGLHASAMIGLRYLASASVYDASDALPVRPTLRQLLVAAGLVRPHDARPTPAFYERWTESF